jgi:hypothetical protein
MTGQDPAAVVLRSLDVDHRHTYDPQGGYELQVTGAEDHTAGREPGQAAIRRDILESPGRPGDRPQGAEGAAVRQLQQVAAVLEVKVLPAVLRRRAEAAVEAAHQSNIFPHRRFLHRLLLQWVLAAQVDLRHQLLVA